MAYWLHPERIDLCPDTPFTLDMHAFIVRIWSEPGLSRQDGAPLWRGQIQDVRSGRTTAFQSWDRLLQLMQAQMGPIECVEELKDGECAPNPERANRQSTG